MPVSVTCPLSGSSRFPQSMADERETLLVQDAKYTDGISLLKNYNIPTQVGSVPLQFPSS